MTSINPGFKFIRCLNLTRHDGGKFMADILCEVTEVKNDFAKYKAVNPVSDGSTTFTGGAFLVKSYDDSVTLGMFKNL